VRCPETDTQVWRLDACIRKGRDPNEYVVYFIGKASSEKGNDKEVRPSSVQVYTNDETN